MARVGRREVRGIGVEALERVEGEGEATRTEKAVRRDTKAASKNNRDNGAEETSAFSENRPRAMPGRRPEVDESCRRRHLLPWKKRRWRGWCEIGMLVRLSAYFASL